MHSNLLHRLEDERLVALVRGGSDDAFAEILRRHRPAMEMSAKRVIRGTSIDVDDVMQEASVRAHRGLRAHRGEMHLAAWLKTVVRNCALSELRRPSTRLAGLSDEPEAELRSWAADDPADRFAQHEALRELVAGMHRLPERQRQALVMRELDGDGHEATAMALETTVPAVKSLIVRARRQLAEELRPAAVAA